MPQQLVAPGSVRLGCVVLCREQLELLLQEMVEDGFGPADYHVMERSCNTFTEVNCILEKQC